MANEEHLKILRRGVQEWNDWRREHPDVLPDLCHANLIGANLSNAILAQAHVISATLTDATLVGAQLSGTNLTRAQLAGAHLSDANLTGATLTGAILIGAQFTGTNLTDTNLQGANLQGTNLHGAILTRANLTGANLARGHFTDVTLARADLTGADFTRAYLGGTKLVDIDLRQAQGLDSVRHYGPSAISTSTFAHSRGQVPRALLKGCGFIDWEIENAKLWNPDLSEEQITTIAYEVIRLRGRGHAFFSAFISYAHDDKSVARKLHDELQDRGIRCWLDERQMLPGDDMLDAVDRGIRLWDKVLLVCSEASLTSWWVEDEITKALEKERKLFQERKEKVQAIIPLDLDGYLFDGWKGGRASKVRERLAADFRRWKSGAELEAEAFERVVRALRADTGAREPSPEPKL